MDGVGVLECWQRHENNKNEMAKHKKFSKLRLKNSIKSNWMCKRKQHVEAKEGVGGFDIFSWTSSSLPQDLWKLKRYMWTVVFAVAAGSGKVGERVQRAHTTPRTCDKFTKTFANFMSATMTMSFRVRVSQQRGKRLFRVVKCEIKIVQTWTYCRRRFACDFFAFFSPTFLAFFERLQ